MAASCSSSWHRFQTAIRPDWLPPGGIGNGWTRRRWAVLVNADASVLILLLDTLREVGIPAHAARLGRLGRRAPASLFRVWVDSWAHARAEDVIREELLRHRPPAGP
jgi:hypothetical protein